MAIRSDLALMQEFTAADTYLCAVALDLQDLGAKFEVRFTKGGWLTQRGNYAFNAKHCRYRMVSLPPGESESESASEPTIEPTIEPGEEFGPEKFQLAEKMCHAGVRFEDRARGSADDWLPIGAVAFRELMRSKSPMVLECHHSRVYRRVPDADGGPASPSPGVTSTTDVPGDQSALDRRAAECSKGELIQLLFEHERQLVSAGFRLAGEAMLSSGENPDLHRALVLAVIEWARVAGEGLDRSGGGS